MKSTITKKYIFEEMTFIASDKGYMAGTMQFVNEGSLAYKILSEGRMYSDKQKWVVTFAIFEAGKEAEFVAYSHMQAHDEVRERYEREGRADYYNRIKRG